MESLSWLFEGLGTEILSFLLGLSSGSIVGYKISKIVKVKQTQKGGDNSEQVQIGNINNGK
jgi:hypothetical protein